jgi:hypothetical protein
MVKPLKRGDGNACSPADPNPLRNGISREDSRRALPASRRVPLGAAPPSFWLTAKSQQLISENYPPRASFFGKQGLGNAPHLADG